MCVGDRNTKHFHHKASQRRKRNYVGLYNSTSLWKEDEKSIESVFGDHFSNIFTSTSPYESSFHPILQHVRHVVSNTSNQDLLQSFTKDEIFGALQQMHPCKGLRP